MKKTILIGCFMLFSFAAFSQVQSIKGKYAKATINEESLFGKTAANIILDEGDGNHTKPLKGEDGKMMGFISTAAALNYLSEKGWRVISVVGTTGNVFFLEKKD